MTGSDKKIAKIFSFIAWMPVKLKFYPMCGGEGAACFVVCKPAV